PAMVCPTMMLFPVGTVRPVTFVEFRVSAAPVSDIVLFGSNSKSFTRESVVRAVGPTCSAINARLCPRRQPFCPSGQNGQSEGATLRVANCSSDWQDCARTRSADDL